MPTQRISWKPSGSANIVAYEILISDTGRDGAYSTLQMVLNQIPGPAYNADDGYFFYDDEEIPDRWYRIRVLDSYGNKAEDAAYTAFQAGNDPVETPSLHYVALTANSGGQNNLQYVSNGGTPIKGATVRVYKKIDWDTQNVSHAVGTTLTTAAGTWTTPVFVEAGETYVIVYHKPNEYGPDTVEITI